MDVQAVIEQIQKLPPEDRRRVEAALRASSSDSHSSQPSSEVEKLAMVKREGLWVITAKSEGELTDDIVNQERERRMQEILGEE